MPLSASAHLSQLRPRDSSAALDSMYAAIVLCSPGSSALSRLIITGGASLALSRLITGGVRASAAVIVPTISSAFSSLVSGAARASAAVIGPASSSVFFASSFSSAFSRPPLTLFIALWSLSWARSCCEVRPLATCVIWCLELLASLAAFAAFFAIVAMTLAFSVAAVTFAAAASATCAGVSSPSATRPVSFIIISSVQFRPAARAARCAIFIAWIAARWTWPSSFSFWRICCSVSDRSAMVSLLAIRLSRMTLAAETRTSLAAPLHTS